MSERHTTLSVSGMTCEHCQSTVRSRLERVEGVERAEVKLHEGLADVVHSEKVSPEVLAEAVRTAGFDAEVRSRPTD